MRRWIPLLLLTAGCVTARDPQPSDPVTARDPQPSKPVLTRAFPTNEIWRVACVGDSVTYGWGGAIDREHEIYTVRLQEMLGPSCVVSNFGLVGAALMNYPDHLWQKALAMKPNAAVLIFGNNDASRDFAEKKDAFVARYVDMIGQLRDLDSHPEIYIGTPIYAYNGEFDRIIVRQVIPAVREVARQTGAPIVDLHTPLAGRLDLMAIDNIHPNARGYNIIAQAVYRRIMAGEQAEPVLESEPEPEAKPEPEPKHDTGSEGYLHRVLRTRSLY